MGLPADIIVSLYSHFRAQDKSSKLKSNDFCVQVSIFPAALISCCPKCLCVLLQCLVAPWSACCHFTSGVTSHMSKARQWPELLVTCQYTPLPPPPTHTHISFYLVIFHIVFPLLLSFNLLFACSLMFWHCLHHTSHEVLCNSDRAVLQGNITRF